jgi:hypothetical protein
MVFIATDFGDFFTVGFQHHAATNAAVGAYRTHGFVFVFSLGFAIDFNNGFRHRFATPH